MVIFCGRSDVLSEVAGEPTALVPWKFVVADPTLHSVDDFAQSKGSSLPRWNGQLRPINGVCFVLTELESAIIGKLEDAGARRDEHFIITSGLATANEDRQLACRLGEPLARLPSRGTIVILGYGQQGQRIAQIMRHDLCIDATRLLVHDAQHESRLAAERDDLTTTNDDRCVDDAAMVIASPLSPYEGIARLLRRAVNAGSATFDNSQRRSGLRQWVQRDNIFLDEAAARALAVSNHDDNHRPASRSQNRHMVANERVSRTIACRNATLRPLVEAHVIRLDERVLAGVAMPHLHSGQCLDFTSSEPLDLANQWPGDRLAASTWQGLRRAFVSLVDRATHGFLASRELCLDLWPEATRRVFPSEHSLDLGCTAFERLLKAKLDVREIVSTMQTPTQRVTLGVAAAHYASSSNRPIIEIGSAYGGSALLMAAATDSTAPSITSIDPDAPTRDIMRFALERHGCLHRLQQIIATSDHAISQLQHLRGTCGVVFIDGLHSAEAVTRDFRNYAPLLSVGGGLLFHDVCTALHSVMQAVIEHVLPDRQFKAMCLVDGLLVLERVA